MHVHMHKNTQYHNMMHVYTCTHEHMSNHVPHAYLHIHMHTPHTYHTGMYAHRLVHIYTDTHTFWGL